MVRTLLFCSLLLAGPAPAQLDGFYWSTSLLGGGGVCNMCVYDAAGTLVASHAYTGLLSSPHIAKHPNGTVWATNQTLGTITPYTLAGGAGTPVPAGNVNVMGIDSTGGIWTFQGSVFTSTLLVQRDAAGTPVQTMTPAAPFAREILGDPFGNIWILSGLTASVQKVSQNATGLGNFTAPGTGSPAGMQIDSQGRPWVLIDAGGVPRLVAFDNNGNVIRNQFLPGALAFAIDGKDQIRVLEAMTVTYYDDQFATVGGFALPAGNVYEGITVDAAGRSWLTSLMSSAIHVIDCGGQLVGVLNLTVPAFTAGAGDNTGRHATSVLARTADSDLDGVTNDREFLIGTDVLDATSTPPTLALGGTPGSGSTISLGLSLPAEAGFPYVVGGSLGTDGIPVGPQPACRAIPLSLDPFALFWLSPANTIATGLTGVLDGSGQASATVTFPPLPLGGITFFLSGVTIVPSSGDIASITAPLTIAL